MKPKDETKPFESRLMEDLHPQLQTAYKRAEKIFNERHNDVHVIVVCTFRNGAMQNLYFTKRPKISNAKAGESPHNYYPSLAFDIAFVKVGKRELDYSPKLFKEFWDIINSDPLNKDIECGLNWKNFKDAPHYQLINWKQLAKLS
jgi:peptidoglycan L-alanyl-D-glutamate endopeptidase CwlK